MSIYKATENIQRQATANVDTPPNEQPYNIKVSTSKLTENIKWAYVGHGGNCLSPEGGVFFPSIVFYFYFPLLYFPCYYNFQIRKWHTACPSLSLYKYCKVLLD